MHSMYSVSTLALAVVLGIASSSSAEPVGPTGKTFSQCVDDWIQCSDSCKTCDKSAPSPQFEMCADAYFQCKEDCHQAYAHCSEGLPARMRTSVGFGLILRNEVTIFQGLDMLSVKLNNLRTQVGAALPPDLVPLPRPASVGPEGFCQLSADLTKLQVHVSNQGTAGSVASTTHVDFANSGGVDMPTPPLAPGGSAVVEFTIPGTCADASLNCYFSIAVDSANAVIESDESNNSAAGVCGPSIF